VIATHSWTIVNMLRNVASWSLSLSFWDLLGTISYTLATLLVDTLLVFMLSIAVGTILPTKWIGHRFIAFSGVVIIAATLLGIVLKPYIYIGFTPDIDRLIFTLVVLLILLGIVILRMKRIEVIFNRIAEPLTTLAFIYIAVDLAGVLIIIIRNI
jgi:hypothetical protein